MAVFDGPEALLAAAKKAHEKGYRRFDAYSPFPVEGLAEALDFKDNHVFIVAFVSACALGIIMYLIMWWSAAIAFPFNQGGKPYNSWPAYIVIAFVLTMDGAALGALFSMLKRNGFPKLYHPVFNVAEFERASRDQFFLCIEADDDAFDLSATRRFLEDLKPLQVMEVEP
jgi:hypothetical protein